MRNRLFRTKLRKFWRFRNFCDPKVAETSFGRIASFKITNCRVFNSGTLIEKLAKLRSSEVMRLLAKAPCLNHLVAAYFIMHYYHVLCRTYILMRGSNAFGNSRHWKIQKNNVEIRKIFIDWTCFETCNNFRKLFCINQNNNNDVISINKGKTGVSKSVPPPLTNSYVQKSINNS